MISSSHPQPTLTPAQMQAQQAAAAQERELAKRRSRKPTDKNIPDGVEDVIVGDGVKRYRELRDVERKLDAAMTRKRLDIQDSVNRNVKVRCASVCMRCKCIDQGVIDPEVQNDAHLGLKYRGESALASQFPRRECV